MFKNTFIYNLYYPYSNPYVRTELDLSNFNTSSVTDMSEMFSGCANSYGDGISGIVSINLSSFNTSNVTNMSGMFRGCYALNNLNLSNFNTQNVTNMSYMFYETSKFVSTWDFFVVWGLSSLDLSNFNTSSVTNMSGMFGECVRISSLNLSNFNMSIVISKTGMCSNLSFCSGVHNYNTDRFENNACNITCPLSVQTAMQSGTGLPSSDQVTFTWVRP